MNLEVSAITLTDRQQTRSENVTIDKILKDKDGNKMLMSSSYVTISATLIITSSRRLSKAFKCDL